ncbi:MAG: class I SAM-dependent methyltransferase [Gammaproteobacteria bacterium]
MAKIALTTSYTNLTTQAELLAKQINIPFVPIEDGQFDYLLVLTPDYLGLIQPHLKKQTPFYLDFLSDKLQYRSKQAGFRKESLARAIGAKPQDQLRIIDATAGLGRDSFILAALGFEVTLVERSPILYALLQDALKRASLDTEMGPIFARMHLIHANAIEYLASQEADIIYLDPMFPSKQKSAAVKKEMAILQELLGKDPDADQLFKVAFSCARKRVVVKRSRLAPNISELNPSFSMTGKSSRFDIYLT